MGKYMLAPCMCKAPVSDPILEKYVNLKEFILDMLK